MMFRKITLSEKFSLKFNKYKTGTGHFIKLQEVTNGHPSGCVIYKQE